MATNPSPEKKELDFLDSGSEYTKRKRTVYTKKQVDILEFYFQNNQYPGTDERKKLSKLTNISEDSLRVWFQNRRAKVAAHTHTKKLAFKTSTSLRSKYPEDVSRDPRLEEDFSEQKFSTPNKSTCPFWAGDSSQELDPRSGYSFERSTMYSAIEAAYLYGYGLSESHPSVFSQTMGSSIDLQSCALSSPMSHGSSNQWTSSLALQGTQRPENRPNNIHSSLYGGLQPPLHMQQDLYPNDHSLPYWCTQEFPISVATATFPISPYPTELPPAASLPAASLPAAPSPVASPPQQPAALQPLMSQAPDFSGTTADLMSTLLTETSRPNTASVDEKGTAVM